MEQIVEASLKATRPQEAFDGKAKVLDFVKGKGWLLAENSLKTRLMMDRCGESA